MDLARSRSPASPTSVRRSEGVDASIVAEATALRGKPYEPVAVNTIAQAAREDCAFRGYASCSVAFVAEPAGAPGEVRVRIKVDEGPMMQLTKIEFRGNKGISTAELLGASDST